MKLGSSKALFLSLVAAMAALAPQLVRAQTTLPIDWMFTPLTQVNSVAYSPNRTLVAAGGGNLNNNGGVEVFNLLTGAVRSFPTSANDIVNAVAFSPDGHYLAVGGTHVSVTNKWKGVIEIWETGTGELVASLPTSAMSVGALAFSPNGKAIADGGQGTEGVLEIWSLASGKEIEALPTTLAFVQSVAFSPDGRSLADGGADFGGYLELWKVATGAQTFSVETPASEGVVTIGFSPDGTVIADGGTSGNEGVLELRGSSSGVLQSSLSVPGTVVNSLAFSNDGSSLLAGGGSQYDCINYDGFVQTWSVATGSSKTAIDTSLSYVYAVAFGPDGKTVLDGGLPTYFSPGALEIWDVEKGTQPMSLNSLAGPSFATSVSYSPDSRLVAIGGSGFRGDMVELWDSQTGTLVHSLDVPLITGSLPEDWVSTAFSPDGRTIAVAVMGQSPPVVLELWDVKSGRLLSTLETDVTLGIANIAFSPDGRKLGVVGGSSANYTKPGILQVWDTSTWTKLYSVSVAGRNFLSAVTFSPDSKWVAAGQVPNNMFQISGDVTIWEADSGRLVKTLDTGVDAGTYGMAFSPDGSKLAVGGGNYVSATRDLELWEVGSAKLIADFQTLPEADGATQVAFSQDGQVLFAATGYGGLEAFSTTRHTFLGSCYGKAEGQVTSLSISPDGNHLAFGIFNNGAVAIAENPFKTGNP